MVYTIKYYYYKLIFTVPNSVFGNDLHRGLHVTVGLCESHQKCLAFEREREGEREKEILREIRRWREGERERETERKRERERDIYRE